MPLKCLLGSHNFLPTNRKPTLRCECGKEKHIDIDWTWTHAYKKDEVPQEFPCPFYRCPNCAVEWQSQPPTYPHHNSGLDYQRLCPSCDKEGTTSRCYF